MDLHRLPPGWHRAPHLRVWVLVLGGEVQALLMRSRPPDDAWIGTCAIGWPAPGGYRQTIVGQGLEPTMRQIEHQLRVGGHVDRALLDRQLAQTHAAGAW